MFPLRPVCFTLIISLFINYNWPHRYAQNKYNLKRFNFETPCSIFSENKQVRGKCGLHVFWPNIYVNDWKPNVVPMFIGVCYWKNGNNSLLMYLWFLWKKQVRELETDPLFNSGRGSALAANGTVEMEASIMDGNGRRCGAVSGLNTVKNPVSLARLVMDKSPHSYLAFSGAEDFARQQVQFYHFAIPHRS